MQSLPDQVRLVTDSLQKEGLYPEIVLTEACSAKEPFVRTDFYELMDRVEKGRITMIAAWHPDRLSRNEIDAARICYLVRKGKLDLHFTNYHFVNTPEGIMMLQLALSQSQYYSSKLSVDVLRGLRSRLEKGWWGGQAPEGYLNDPATRTIIPDPERLPLIKRAFDLVLTRTMTAKEVIDELRRWGYVSRLRATVRMKEDGSLTRQFGGRPLSRASGYTMLNSIFYAGYFVVKGEIMKGSHEPIITLDQYYEIQEILGHRKGVKKLIFVYNGLVSCGNCGGLLCGQVQHGTAKNASYVYYRCARGCTGKSLRERDLTAAIEDQLGKITFSIEFKKGVLFYLREWMQENFGADNTLLSTQARAARELEQRRAGLLRMRAGEEITADEFAAENIKIRSEMARTEAAISRTRRNIEAVSETVERVTDFACFAHQAFQSDSIEARRSVAMALVQRYVYKNGSVEVILDPLLDILQKGRLELSDLASDKQKTGNSLPAISLGRAERTILETVFRLVQSGQGFAKSELGDFQVQLSSRHE